MAHDCIVVGGGPAGLVAAVYLARFRRDVRVIDAGASRASLIPTSHNCPGFPEGIGGIALLERLRAQAKRYGAVLTSGTVGNLQRDADGTFRVCCNADTYHARSVLIATGVLDIEPELPNVIDAVRRGLVRHCPICDGYEVIGRNVAVIGRGGKGAREAAFIRHFTDSVTLFTLGTPDEISDRDRAVLDERGIAVVDEKVESVEIEGNAILGITMAGGRTYCFETLYSALGCSVRSDLAIQLGARRDKVGQIVVDDHQRTGIPGLYAAGDVANDLNQIAVAAGHAAIAATAIHNELQSKWTREFIADASR